MNHLLLLYNHILLVRFPSRMYTSWVCQTLIKTLCSLEVPTATFIDYLWSTLRQIVNHNAIDSPAIIVSLLISRICPQYCILTISLIRAMDTSHIWRHWHHYIFRVFCCPSTRILPALPWLVDLYSTFATDSSVNVVVVHALACYIYSRSSSAPIPGEVRLSSVIVEAIFFAIFICAGIIGIPNTTHWNFQTDPLALIFTMVHWKREERAG